MLPAQLVWDEDQPAALADPSHEIFSSQTLFSQPSAGPSSQSGAVPSGLMFSNDLDAPPVSYPYAIDILTALLRTRYYHLKHLLYRPFLYKALHFPDQMTNDDAQGVATCLKACLRWPLAMSPTAKHKRLVPCLCLWSQNLLAVLLTLHLSQQVPILLRIRTTLCGKRFDIDAGETVGLYIDWIRDLKEVDPAARWCWEIVKAVYRLDDG